MRILNILITTALILFWTSCSTPKTEQKDIVSVTIEPLRYFVENITGHTVPVNVVVPPGASPETFEPTAQSIKQVNDSKLFIATGVLEPEINLLRSLPESKRRLILKDKIETIEGECTGDDHHNHGIDPHIWLSPAEAHTITRSITDELCAVFPDSCEKYRENSRLLLRRIDSLDQYMKNRFDTLKNRSFIIYHPALAYLARQYGLRQISIEKDGKEPSGSALKALIDTARIQKIGTIFYQAQLSSRAIQTLAKELNAQIVEIDPLSYQWIENMRSITDAIAGKQSEITSK